MTAELDRPFSDRPFEGGLSFFVEYSGTAIDLDGFSPVGTVMDEEQFGGMLQRLLERSFKSSRAVDLESLCVLTGQQVWHIRVDAHIICDDGNVSDSLVMGVLAALMDFRRPDVQVSAEGAVTVFSAYDRHPLPLTLHHFPIACTFAVCEDTDGRLVALLDPCSLESLVEASSVLLVMNRQGEIIHCSKPGGTGVSFEFILESIVPIAKEVVIKLSDQMTTLVSTRPIIQVIQ